jgi:hypothetical protein
VQGTTPLETPADGVSETKAAVLRLIDELVPLTEGERLLTRELLEKFRLI